MGLFNKRTGAVVFFVFFIFTLRQLINSQLKLGEVNDQLLEKRDEYLERKGAKSKNNEEQNYFYGGQRLGNSSGLTVKEADFLLNGKPFRILSGSIHYFRFPPEYWKARLHALKASGLNTVTTYVAWNAHEPVEGKFDFSGSLDLAKFMQTAHDLGIFVILRPGPYICAEWEWGGLPSWLLRDHGMKVRTRDPAYMNHVKKWFNELLKLVKPYQFSQGGPVIALQVENEYASFPNSDPAYVVMLRDIIVESGIKEFLFACDDRNGVFGAKLDYGGMMKSINFQHNPAAVFKQLKEAQPEWPLFVSEYWTGWFNWWDGPNHDRGVPWSSSLDTAKFEKNTKEVFDAGGHMNMYMFAGGTNFGFLNGGMISHQKGNDYRTSPDTTSYDYDAVITEEGKLTPKFHVTRKLIQALQPSRILPDPPHDPELASYDSITIDSYVKLADLLVGFKDWMIESDHPVPMEMFPGNGGRRLGQAYGYAVYETGLDAASSYKIDLDGKVRDRAQIFLDTIYQATAVPPMGVVSLKADGETKHTISLLVENQGRINWVSRGQHGIFENQRKGVLEDIICNDKILTNWRIWPLEFDKPFLDKLSHLTSNGEIKWQKDSPGSETPIPILARAYLSIDDPTPKDTFIEIEGFDKGIIIINGRNIGRYWNSAGPQKRLFLPGVWLRQGKNEILIFEELKIGTNISFHTSSGMK